MMQLSIIHFKTRLGIALIGFCLISTVPALSQCYKVESDISIELPKTSERLYDLGVDTTQIDSVFEALKKSKMLKSQYAALFLAEHGERDAVELIKKKVEQERSFPRAVLRYLKALDRLNADSTDAQFLSLANSLYQDISDRKATRSDYYTYKNLTEILISKNDYSQFPRITGKLQSNNRIPHSLTFLHLLSDFFEVESFRDEIINTLQFILQNYSTSTDLLVAVNYTCVFPESIRLQQALKKVAAEAPSFNVRQQALIRLRDTFKDAEVMDLALHNLKETSDPHEVRSYFSLINAQHTPRSLFLITKLKDESINNVVQERAADMYSDYWWLYFEPYSKVFDYSLSQSIDSLKAYTHDISSYDWLGDKDFVKELTKPLDNAGNYLARGDSSNTARQLISYKELLQKEYEQNPQNTNHRFVTENGYKFLSKNADYLMTLLPQNLPNKNGD